MDIIDPTVDYLALAASFGVPARRVERAADISGAVEAGIASGRPNLIDVAITPWVPGIPVARVEGSIDVTTIQALAFASFTFANSITPGPNNTMLLASGANYGFARTVPHIAGITAGCIVMLLLVGFGLGQFFAAFPVIYDVLRDVGAAYLLWLAWKIARASPPSADRAEARPMTFLQAAVFQWVNPKAWIIVISAVTAYTNHAGFGNDVITLAVILSLVMTPSIGVWAGCGTVLKAILLHPGRIRAFNMAMALLLVLSLLPMFAM